MNENMDLQNTDALDLENDEEIVTMTDDEGNEYEYLVQGRIEWQKHCYIILEDLSDEGGILICYENYDEQNELMLDPVEDSAENETVYYYFMAEIDDYEFCDAE